MPQEPTNWSSRYINSLWSETDRTWDDPREDWRIVGSNPFPNRQEVDLASLDSEDYLHIVEFPSKRLDIAFLKSHKIEVSSYVIIEADRGEDCGIVRGHVTKQNYMELLQRNKGAIGDLRLKKIYRLADWKDLCLLEELQRMNKKALEKCNTHSSLKKLNMEIIDCEYQFDKKKITFFYRSDERIDFRELVKDLYKIFKTRIWMCSIDRTKDRILSNLFCDISGW